MFFLNLLPWRDTERAARKKYRRQRMIITLIAMWLLLIATHFGLNYAIQLKEKSVHTLKSALEDQETALRPLKNSQVLAEIYAHSLGYFSKEKDRQHQLLDLFNVMIQHTPDEVSFTNMEYKANTVFLSGEASSPDAISQCISRLTKHSPFKTIVLEKLEKDRKKARVYFKIKLSGSLI